VPGQWYNYTGENECGHAGSYDGNPVTFNPANPPSKVLSSAFAYLKDASHIAEMGIAAGASPSHPGLTDELKAEFNRAFYNQSTGRYGLPETNRSGTAVQTQNALPLLLNLSASDSDRQRVEATLVHDIAVERQNHTSTGIVGLRALYEVLSNMGRADLAVATLLQVDYPSFGYQVHNVDEPATTIWEVYDADRMSPSMDSRNHVMFATPSYFFYSAVVGITPVRGDRLWSVAPAAVDTHSELTSASATVWTPRGALTAGWTIVPVGAGQVGAGQVGGGDAPTVLLINVTVPVGLVTHVTLAVPASSDSDRCTVILVSAGTTNTTSRSGANANASAEGAKGGASSSAGVVVWDKGNGFVPGFPGVMMGTQQAHPTGSGSSSIVLRVGSGAFSMMLDCV
jgi:hypothetical protein